MAQNAPLASEPVDDSLLAEAPNAPFSRAILECKERPNALACRLLRSERDRGIQRGWVPACEVEFISKVDLKVDWKVEKGFRT